MSSSPFSTSVLLNISITLWRSGSPGSCSKLVAHYCNYIDLASNGYSTSTPENFLSLIQFWMITLPSRVFLVGFFFFHHFEYIVIPFWPAKFLLKNLQIVLWGFITSCFSLAAFKILPLSLTFDILIVMCLSGSLWVHFICNSLGFLDLDICFFPQVREVSSHYFFK